jgi:hypothetical protein
MVVLAVHEYSHGISELYLVILHLGFPTPEFSHENMIWFFLIKI